MYSQRGQLTLAHTDATVRAFRQRAEVNKHFGGQTELIDPADIAKLVPTLNLNPANLPVLAGLWQYLFHLYILERENLLMECLKQ